MDNKIVNKRKVDTKLLLVAGGIIAGMALIFFLATSVVPRALITLTRASSSEKVVVSGSYLIGEKILAKADGKDTAVVNVFLLDKNGKGVDGMTVDLIGMDGVEAVNSLSGSDGRLRFELTSIEEKQYRINAVYAGQELPQTIVVTFRN